MHVSKLDEIYSLSSKMTRKEMVQRYANYTEIDISHKQEPMKYIDQYTDKVKSELRILRDKCPLCSSKNISFLFIKHGFDHMLCNECDLIFTLQVLDRNKINFLVILLDSEYISSSFETCIIPIHLGLIN